VALGFGTPALGLLADFTGLGAAFVASMVAAVASAGIAGAMLYAPRTQQPVDALARC